ncbi:nuclear transport factor 2 family protein [Pimelobacter sp. 30-1]|uniref:YybH family protein n=1 Tax=Pimelobacter sp. 30-1 TaxID=2004991 RepID=UPI001C045A3E|nr:nuclear transport factor 2 family protein [Pimelobacter sp. 30-1]MBU2695449.1 hypothetical protein [Pimelobacter sp. 30-1]
MSHEPNPQPDELHDLVRRLEDALRTGDLAAVAALCDPDPSITFYDVDGHLYRGARHWARRPPLPEGRPRLDDVAPEVTVRGPLALVTWSGAEIARATALVVRRPGGWRVVHLHHSPATPGPRPGNI